MVNEVLAKVLYNNIYVDKSHYELGINAAFWGDEPTALPAVAETVEVDPVGMWPWV